MSVTVTMGVVNMPLVSTFMVDISVSAKMATMEMEKLVLVSGSWSLLKECIVPLCIYYWYIILVLLSCS